MWKKKHRPTLFTYFCYHIWCRPTSFTEATTPLNTHTHLKLAHFTAALPKIPVSKNLILTNITKKNIAEIWSINYLWYYLENNSIWQYLEQAWSGTCFKLQILVLKLLYFCRSYHWMMCDDAWFRSSPTSRQHRHHHHSKHTPCSI